MRRDKDMQALAVALTYMQILIWLLMVAAGFPLVAAIGTCAGVLLYHAGRTYYFYKHPDKR